MLFNLSKLQSLSGFEKMDLLKSTEVKTMEIYAIFVPTLSIQLFEVGDSFVFYDHYYFVFNKPCESK